MQKWGLYIFKSQRLPSEEGGQQPQPYCLARVKGAWRASCDGTWVHGGVRRQRRLCISFNDTQTEPRVWPPRRLMYRSVVTKLWGGGKFTKRQTRWQKSTNSPSKPASLALSPSLFLSLSHTLTLSLSRSPRHPTGRRGSSGEHDTARLQVTDMSHHLKPRGTIIPLSLWREMGGWRGGESGGEREWGGGGGDGWYRARVSEWEEKWRVCGVGGAGGCFTPGLFKETAQGMPLALLTKHFFFFFFFAFLFFFSSIFFFFFFLSIAGCAPVKSSGPQSSPTAIWGCLRNFFSQTSGPVSVPMFQMNNPALLRPCRGVTRGAGIDGGGLMSDFAAEGASLHSSKLSRAPLTVGFSSLLGNFVKKKKKILMSFSLAPT